MPWGSSIAGNGITVLSQETFADYPIGFAELPQNGSMSIGYFRCINGGPAAIVVPNTTVQATSIIISVQPADPASATELIRVGQHLYASTAGNVAGVSFTINLLIAPLNTGVFAYWLIHPARP